MLNIESIKINIYTNTGLFGRSINFNKGLNIVRGNNTSGKSSLFGAIVYGLGFEELLGSRNEKAMQSLFKSIVKEIDIENKEIIKESVVNQSEILLQISNGTRSVTIKRVILHDTIKPQAIEVFEGKVLTDLQNEVTKLPMYIHDKGGASSEEVGFHKFLEDFIGAKLPFIINQEGNKVKLYLPLIAAAHFIEQKSGWSDFFANTPYYKIRDTASKIFEYVLNLKVFENAADRQEIQNELRKIEEKWNLAVEKINLTIKRGGGEIVGVPESPENLTPELRPFTRFLREDKSLSLSEIITQSKAELEVIIQDLSTPINDKTESIENNLSSIKEQNERYEIFYESLSSETSQERERYRQYLTQLKNVQEDLRKNKDALKIQELGLQSNLKLGSGICPTCNQNIHNSLLDPNINISPMRIDENISYLNAQQKMIDAFVRNLRENILEKETRLSSLENVIQGNRQRVRLLKRDLISDDRLPSEEIIERKIILERELSFFYKLKEELEGKIEELYTISKEFNSIKSSQKNLNKEYHSFSDRDKLAFFEDSFRTMLFKFGFTSKPVTLVKISNENYLPVYQVQNDNGIMRQVDIRYESSASDFIRAQWAYYISLLKTSVNKNGHHFQTLLFDEPQQQSASNKDFKAFLKELESFKNQQIIVLASFQDSEEDFKEATEDLVDVNIIDLGKTNELMIQRLSQ